MRFANARLAAFVLTGLLLIFTVPYFVGVTPSASPSYVFGYSNRAGILIFLAFSALAVLSYRQFAVVLEPGQDSGPVPRRSLWFGLIAVAACCGLMLVIAGGLGGFGESNYEIDRIRLLAQGRIPYVDFEWPFGLSFLYIPLELSRILGISLVAAYHAFWVCNCLAGTVALYLAVNLIDYPSDQRGRAFLLLFGANLGSIVTMGTHYAFLRQAFPLLAVIAIAAVLARPAAGGRWSAVLLMMASICLALLISPETALGIAFSAGCMFLLSMRTGRAPWIEVLAAALGSILLFLAAFKLGALNTLLASGGGADSFPVAPAAHIVFLFFTTVICALYLRSRLSTTAIPNGLLALILYCVPMLVPALSRCDPGHVFLNGQGLIIAGLFLMSAGKTHWKYYQAAFVVIFIVLANVSMLIGYRPLLGKAVLSLAVHTDLGRSRIASYARSHAASKMSKIIPEISAMGRSAPPLSALYPQWRGDFLAPFGYSPLIGTSWDPRIEFGFYEGLENANTAVAVARKIQELKNAPGSALLLPKDYSGACSVDALADRKIISSLFMTPYLNRVKNKTNIHQALCDYIATFYVAAVEAEPDNFNYGLWVERSHLGDLNGQGVN